MNEVLLDSLLGLLRNVGQVDAVADVNLTALNAQLVRIEVRVKHVVQHLLHVLLGQEVDRRDGKQVGAVVDEQPDFGTALVEQPRFGPFTSQNGVDAHLLDGRLAELAQG